MTHTLPREALRRDRPWLAHAAAVLGALLLAFSGLGGFGGLLGIGEKWLKADYSHGFLVAPFAMYLLWRNRGSIPAVIAWPVWTGVPLVLGAVGLFFIETKLNVAMEWVQGASFLVALLGVTLTFTSPAGRRRRPTLLTRAAAGLALLPVPFALLQMTAPRVLIQLLPGDRYPMALVGLAAGLGLAAAVAAYRHRAACGWAVPALLMLGLALPLPDSVESTLGFKLREFATTAALYVFRTLGLAAFAPTSVTLTVDSVELSVEAACSGLSMLLAFVALSAAIAFLCPPSRPAADRWIVFLSAVPVAVLCNVARIVLSGLVLAAGWKAAFDVIVHDFAGWLMMPAALGLIWLEFRLLDWLYVPVRYASRDEVARASFADAKAAIEQDEAGRLALLEAIHAKAARPAPAPATDPHPAAAFLPLTPVGTGSAATASRSRRPRAGDDLGFLFPPKPPADPRPGGPPAEPPK